MTAGENAWPSPRSWEMASALLAAGLDVAPAVGPGPAAELEAYLDVIGQIPDLDRVAGGASNVAFPAEASLRYAAVTGLVARCATTEQALNGFRWLVDAAPAEWVQLFATDLFPLLRERGELDALHQALMADAKLRAFVTEFARMMAG